MTQQHVTQAATIKKGMNVAIHITASPHEWKWSQEEQEAMAKTCLEFSRLLTAREKALREIASYESPEELKDDSN